MGGLEKSDPTRPDNKVIRGIRKAERPGATTSETKESSSNDT